MRPRIKAWVKVNVFWVTVAVLYALLAFVFWLLVGIRIELGTEFGLPLEWLWFGLVIGYTLVSITSTGLSERALKLFLGIPIQEIPPGRLVFIPLGFYRLERVPIAIQQMELPGEPEQVWRFKDEQNRELPLGLSRDGKPVEPPKKVENGKEITLPWVQPIRVPFDDESPFREDDPIFEISNLLGSRPAFRRTPGTPKRRGAKAKEEEDPASKRVTTEASGMLQWRVRDLATFIRSFDNFENAKKQLFDIAVSEMSGVLQAGTLARALANQELLGYLITQKIRERVEHAVSPDGHPKGDTVSCRRGVEIIRFQLKPPGLSHELNLAIQEILEAKARAGATIREAEGDQKRMELLDQWAGKPGGALMLTLEQLRTIREALGPRDKVIMIDGRDPLAGLFSSVAGSKALLEAMSVPTGGGSTSPPSTSPPAAP